MNLRTQSDKASVIRRGPSVSMKRCYDKPKNRNIPRDPERSVDVWRSGACEVGATPAIIGTGVQALP